MLSAAEDSADAVAFARCVQDDRHHFRFVVAPEDAGEMTDLRAFSPDLATQMDAHLHTRLDWVAIAHWNTQPNVHLLVRGVAQDGVTTFSDGLWARAEDLVSAELDPRPEHEIRSVLAREVDAERWTRLDGDPDGGGRHRDRRPATHNPARGDPEVRRFGGADDPRPRLVIAARSDFDLARRVARGATWLDYRLSNASGCRSPWDGRSATAWPNISSSTPPGAKLSAGIEDHVRVAVTNSGTAVHNPGASQGD